MCPRFSRDTCDTLEIDMVTRTHELTADYASALAAFIRRQDEEALARAAALGRQALASGLGVLELVRCHLAAMARILGNGTAAKIGSRGAAAALRASSTFLCESLSTFEVARQAFRDASDSFVRMAQFNAVVSHELRTPLTSIVAALGLLEEIMGAAAGSDTARLLANMRSGADILRARTNDLQDLVSLQSGILRLRPRPTDLAQVIKGCTRRMEPEFEKAGVRLRLDVSPGATWIVADPDRLDQVVTNLVQNALKYGAAGGAVDLRLSAAGGTAVIAVQDYGPGVSARDKARIFQPYVRGGNPRPEVPGMGIGLALSSELVRQHGGTIRLESEEGVGSIFRVELPMDAGRDRPEDKGP
jgi:signal transduction histidine kinase